MNAVAAMAVLVRCVLLAAAVAAVPAGAAEEAAESPVALVKSTSEEMLAIIARTQDREQLHEAVETKVVPYFNFEHMTQLALGRSWKQASPTQQEAVVDAFRKLLVRTYTNAFAAAKQRNASVKVTPLAGGAAGKNEVIVRTKVTPAGGQPISIDYEMESLAAGWKVFDVVVDSVSLVTVYRDSFATEVKQSGIDGLIKSLNEKNHRASGS